MKFGLVLDNNKREAAELSGEIEDYLIGRGQEVERDQGKLAKVDVIIVLGGDGTLLHMACSNVELSVPFVGINVGRLGFLTAAESIDWHEAVERLIRRDYIISERMTLEAKLEPEKAKGEGETRFWALNEAVIKAAYRVVDLEVSVDGQKFLSIAGDGVIVATQTGSTAYSLSSGGPIVDPHLDSFVITPINALGLPIPSIVISPDGLVEVEIKRGEDVSLIIDGQEHKKVSKGQRIKVSRGKHKVKFAYFSKHQFLKSLNAKFGLASRLIG